LIVDFESNYFTYHQSLNGAMHNHFY